MSTDKQILREWAVEDAVSYLTEDGPEFFAFEVAGPSGLLEHFSCQVAYDMCAFHERPQRSVSVREVLAHHLTGWLNDGIYPLPKPARRPHWREQQVYDRALVAALRAGIKACEAGCASYDGERDEQSYDSETVTDAAVEAARETL